MSQHRIEPMQPQPPNGIRYLLGNESWLPAEERSPLRLHIEEWGNLGPMELNPEIQKNAAGFRVRTTDVPAPPWARGFATRAGVLVWTSEDRHGGDLPTALE